MFKVIGCELWSDDPMFEAETQKTGVTGICGSGIIEVVAEMVSAGVLSHDGKIKTHESIASQRVVADGRTFAFLLHEGKPDVRVTPNDVRAIQLAKAALHAGAMLLMEHFVSSMSNPNGGASVSDNPGTRRGRRGARPPQ